MQTGIHVGNVVNKETTENLARAVERILDSGFKNHASDAVQVKALDVVRAAFDVTGTVVQYNTLSGIGKK